MNVNPLKARSKLFFFLRLRQTLNTVSDVAVYVVYFDGLGCRLFEADPASDLTALVLLLGVLLIRLCLEVSHCLPPLGLREPHHFLRLVMAVGAEWALDEDRGALRIVQVLRFGVAQLLERLQGDVLTL